MSKVTMIKKSNISEVVAVSMQQIIQSNDQKRSFTKKASENECCSCSSCGDKCPCDGKCDNNCKNCKDDKNHVHDSNCIHDKTSAVNEMISLLSKISAVQDELGLVTSSVKTIQALATMVKELNKFAQEDSNDIRWDEVIKPIQEDTELRREFNNTEREYPEIMELLKKRIDESDAGVPSSRSTVFDDGVSADGLESDRPTDPDQIVINPLIETWNPEAENHPTNLPPESQIMERPLPYEGDVNKFNQILDADLEDPTRDSETIRPIASNINDFFKKVIASDEDEPDFEDENDEKLDEEFASLMGNNQHLDPILTNEMSDEDLFGLPDESLADDLGPADHLVYDFDHEREDADPGFDYSLNGNDEDLIRMHSNDWRAFKDLSDDEKANQEEGAGMRDRLDIDPDELSYEDLPTFDDEDYEDGPEDKIGKSLFDELDRYDHPLEAPDDLLKSTKFWND
jgi:hypothetical protein